VKVALTTLSSKGAAVARYLAARLPDASVFVHKGVEREDGERSFDRVLELTESLVEEFDGIIYVMPTGVAVRALEGNLRHKREGPCAVVVDVGGRYAISLVGGHEAGGNALAMGVANVLDAEPIVTTSSEAALTLVAGVGCRKGVSADTVEEAVQNALDSIDGGAADLRLLASADIKKDEEGLLEAARKLDVPARFISSKRIRECRRDFRRSEVAERRVGLPAVAEPAALLAGTRTTLCLQKTIYGPVTVALAREDCLWSE
jgi:cobalt-precorrin 5A hydrolase